VIVSVPVPPLEISRTPNTPGFISLGSFVISFFPWSKFTSSLVPKLILIFGDDPTPEPPFSIGKISKAFSFPESSPLIVSLLSFNSFKVSKRPPSIPKSSCFTSSAAARASYWAIPLPVISIALFVYSFVAFIYSWMLDFNPVL
jgi:hypothetical protein